MAASTSLLRGEAHSSWCAYVVDRCGWATPDAGVCKVKEALHLCIVVFGATGDLAEKKTFPSLASLYNRGFLPEHTKIIGYGRSPKTIEQLHKKISSKLPGTDEEKQNFLKTVSYCDGLYDTAEGFHKLLLQMQEHEKVSQANTWGRLFYLALPPSVYLEVLTNIRYHAVDFIKAKEACEVGSDSWFRVIIEKPFGRDLASSEELSENVSKLFSEQHLYRIDHFLGKEVTQNMLVMRFENTFMSAIWSREHIDNIQIVMKEAFGTEGRGGYFDKFGIIRDVIQNHLLQILALFAMECPVSLEAEDIRNEKVKLLRNIQPISLDDVVVGQYRGVSVPGQGYLPGYLDDDTVPEGSNTETFSAVACFINNARWDGVPFLLKAGKALQRRSAQIRVQFRHVPGNVFTAKFGPDFDRNTNELVIRIQPQEAIYMTINNKVPGLGLDVKPTRLDLSYSEDLNVAQLPDAYERLLLDVVNGDKRLFIRNDELDAAWQLFTPVLEALKKAGKAPEMYPYGSRGPIGAHYLAAKYGIRWGDLMDEDEGQ